MTQDDLKSRLSYDPVTGVFTWLRQIGHVNPGDIAGSTSDNGYVRIGIKKKDYRAHRLAWLFMTGDLPDIEIDHVNRNRADNRWVNLRLATPKQNRENLSLRPDNSSGVIGVGWSKRENKWRAQIGNNSKGMSLGYYGDFFEAICARKAAEMRFFTHSPGVSV